MVVLTVTYAIRSGCEEEALAHFTALARESRKEPGNLTYLVHRSLHDPCRFMLYEAYADEAALEEHRASAHYDRYGRAGIMQLMQSRSPELYERIDA